MTDTTPNGQTPKRTPHFVSREPWDPYVSEKLSA